MAESCRSVPNLYPPRIRKEDGRFRNVRVVLDNAQKYLGEETGSFDTHGQGRKDNHNG